MEALNYFTCISYDNVDFLIQSKYIIFGIYLDVTADTGNIEFNREILPHIHIGTHLEKEFGCKAKENCNVVLVMKIQDFAADVRAKIEACTKTAFPRSGNFALSVSSSITNTQIDISNLHLIPKNMRAYMTNCGVCAISFIKQDDNKSSSRAQLLISPDSLLRKLFSAGLIKQTPGDSL